MKSNERATIRKRQEIHCFTNAEVFFFKLKVKKYESINTIISKLKRVFVSLVADCNNKLN